jgi:hypothetical protein
MVGPLFGIQGEGHLQMKYGQTLLFVGLIVLAGLPMFASDRFLPLRQRAGQDNWQRMKECTARVDLLARREKWSADKTILGRESHYSEQFRRCFLKLSHRNPEAAKDPSLLPSVYYELWDPFEEKLLAICTDAAVTGNGMFCTIQDQEHFRDCGVCRAFVKDRMTK